MNLVFIGSSSFGFRCLQTCMSLTDIKVVGVVTAPRTFAISYRPSGVTNILHADIAEFASSYSIPTQTLESSMNEPNLFEAVAAWRPDTFLVAGWYHMIPKRWRTLAPAYGLHASLLPDYSGGAPLVWAMINGETQTGITLFQMDDGVDSGPIVGQKEEPILPTDTIASLYARIEEHGLSLIRETLPQISAGTLVLRDQDETKRRIMPQRSPEDGLINWYQDAKTIDRFIRAQTHPYPGAFSTLNGSPFTIWQAKPSVQDRNDNPGQIWQTADDNYIVTSGAGGIILSEVTYDQRTYTQKQLPKLLGEGGQRLGVSPNSLAQIDGMNDGKRI